MDRDILKSLVAFLITGAAILGPTLLEWLKRRMKADLRNHAPQPPQLSRMKRKAAEVSAAKQPKPADHREAMLRASEKESARVISADTHAATMPDAPIQPVQPAENAPARHDSGHAPAAAPAPVNSRAAALRRAVIAAEVLQRKF